MPQSVAFDIFVSRGVKRKRKSFPDQLGEKKRKMSGGISGHLARLFVCWNERSISLFLSRLA
jgi:hypothetical protein